MCCTHRPSTCMGRRAEGAAGVGTEPARGTGATQMGGDLALPTPPHQHSPHLAVKGGAAPTVCRRPATAAARAPLLAPLAEHEWLAQPAGQGHVAVQPGQRKAQALLQRGSGSMRGRAVGGVSWGGSRGCRPGQQRSGRCNCLPTTADLTRPPPPRCKQRARLLARVGQPQVWVEVCAGEIDCRRAAVGRKVAAAAGAGVGVAGRCFLGCGRPQESLHILHLKRGKATCCGCQGGQACAAPAAGNCSSGQARRGGRQGGAEQALSRCHTGGRSGRPCAAHPASLPRSFQSVAATIPSHQRDQVVRVQAL